MSMWLPYSVHRSVMHEHRDHVIAQLHQIDTYQLALLTSQLYGIMKVECGVAHYKTAMTKPLNATGRMQNETTQVQRTPVTCL